MAIEKKQSDCHAWESPRKMEVMKMCVGGCPASPSFAQDLLRPPKSAKVDRVSLRSNDREKFTLDSCRCIASSEWRLACLVPGGLFGHKVKAG